MVKVKLCRVGTIYLPVTDVVKSVDWYVQKTGAELSYQDKDKAILNLAEISIFLVRTDKDQTSNFLDIHGNERFFMTFEVDGLAALEQAHQELKELGCKLGEIEQGACREKFYI